MYCRCPLASRALRWPRRNRHQGPRRRAERSRPPAGGRIRDGVGEGLRLRPMKRVNAPLFCQNHLRAEIAANSSVVQTSQLRGVAAGEAEQLGDVQPHHPVGLQAAELGRDHGPSVIADRPVAVITELGHQLGPGSGDPFRPPAGRGSRPRSRRQGGGNDSQVAGPRLRELSQRRLSAGALRHWCHSLGK
jgi:hypothetical protein